MRLISVSLRSINVSEINDSDFLVLVSVVLLRAFLVPRVKI